MTDNKPKADAPGEQPRRVLSRNETHDLSMIIKDRAKVLKAHVEEQAAAHLSDFERQVSTQYRFDQDETWEQAAREAAKVVTEANDKIIAKCKKLGIPAQFAPQLHLQWANRGQSMMQERRTELRLAAKSAIDAMSKVAMTRIDHQSLELRTQVVAAGLLSDEARMFLDSLAPVTEAMGSLDFQAIAGKIEDERKKRQKAYALLYGSDPSRGGHPRLTHDD